MKTKNIDRKNSFWYTLGLTLYAFTSFFFLIIATRINGVDEAGIYAFGFSFATMMQIIANYAGRTFQVTERKSWVKDSDFLIFKILTCLIMIIISICFCWTRNYDSYKFLIIMLLVIYRAFDSFSEAIFGIFQKNNNLYQCGISFTLKGTFCVIVFAITDYLSSNLLLSVFSLLVTNIIIFLSYDFMLLKKYKIKWKILKFKTFKYLTLSGFSIFVVFFLAQYLFMTQKFIIDIFMDNQSQTIFGIIIMPASFVSVCANMIINPFLYRMNEALKSNNIFQFNMIIKKIFIYIIIIGATTLALTYTIGIPILNIIYNLDLSNYLWPLMIIVLGSISTAFISVISNSMIALRKNISQMIIYLLGAIISTIISYYLIELYGISGASWAYGISMILLLIMYSMIYIYISRNNTKNNKK